MSEDRLQHLQQTLARFAAQRDWEQFHSPKNLSMALIAEAAELVEHFQWLTEHQSQHLEPEQHRKVALEMADILIYLLRLAERLDIDLIEAALEKTAMNEKRFPVHRVKGRAGRGVDFQADEGPKNTKTD